MTLAIVGGLCVLAFAVGWGMARLLGAGREQRIALMFALGMNNNGTGLVLASMALADHPRVMLPIIFYNMVQHLVAGGANSLIRRPAGRSRRAASRTPDQPAASPRARRTARPRCVPHEPAPRPSRPPGGADTVERIRAGDDRTTRQARHRSRIPPTMSSSTNGRHGGHHDPIRRLRYDDLSAIMEQTAARGRARGERRDARRPCRGWGAATRAAGS